MLILARISFLGTEFEKTVEQTGLANSEVLRTVPDTSVVTEVLRFMFENQVSGVALVDPQHKIVGNFSATDMLNLTQLNFPLLSLSVREFLLRIYGFTKPPVICRNKDTVETVMLKFACYGVHRVYIVNEDFTPTGVITTTDIIKFLQSPVFRQLPGTVSPLQLPAK